jgi:hypothetical protein
MKLAMKPALWISVIVLAPVAAAVVWSVSRPNYREVKLADGTIVLASLRGGFSRTAEFFSVRLEDAAPGSAVRSTAHLHLRGRDFVLRDLSPSGLEALGINIESASADEQLAFVGYGEQNREGGLEFRFSGGKLRAFYGRCHIVAKCDFELSWPNHDRFRLPIPEARLLSAIDRPISVTDYSAH